MIWIKPSGVEVETNDLPATIEAAKKLDWKEKKEEVKKQKKKTEK